MKIGAWSFLRTCDSIELNNRETSGWTHDLELFELRVSVGVRQGEYNVNPDNLDKIKAFYWQIKKR